MAMAADRGVYRRVREDQLPVHPDALLAPEQALRPDQQDQDQGDQGADRLEVDGVGEDPRPELDEDADDEVPSEGTERGCPARRA